MKFQLLNRKVHYWGSFLVAIPVLVIITSGLVLQLKKEIRWVQPPENRGRSTVPVVGLDDVLAACRGIPEARIEGWEDVSRIDIRPSKGILKVVATSNWEVQLDGQTGEVLQVAYRRSDIIEAIHDGSWFHDLAKHWVFLPSAVGLLVLWVTGMYLFILPYTVRWNRARKARLLTAVLSGSHSPGKDGTAR